jgi:tetratricopeptide (TPR) repeat protein
MANRWEEAVKANRAVIALFPNDADSYNRLGKALMELGRYNEAKKTYKKALELDGTNQIAKKNLERLGTLAKAGRTQAETTQVDPKLFIEEMGKSAVIALKQTESNALAKLSAGDRVELRLHGATLAVETPAGEFIGAVEAKLGLRLMKLMDGGNRYAAGVTSLTADECRIIIKETYQDPSLAGRPSFPTATTADSLRAYTKESLIHYGTQVETKETAEETGQADAGEMGGDGRDAWANDRVHQEGHVRLFDAAAAEEAEEEEDEE